MTLHGVDAASDAAYTDALCRGPSLTAFWGKVAVTGDEAIRDTTAAVRIKRSGAPAIAAGVRPRRAAADRCAGVVPAR
jgi:hypothetical protein